MKNLLATLLLTVYLFNLAGYSLWFQHFINKADKNLIQQANKNAYDEKDLVEVKVPLNMPYITDAKDYERIDGQLESNSIHYNYIKRKIVNDTLYILCLPNVPKIGLYNAKAAYGREVNDLPINPKTSGGIKKLGFNTEYNPTSGQFAYMELNAVSEIKYSAAIATGLYSTFLSLPKQPPKTFG